MADLSFREHLRPSLLERLTDERPKELKESRFNRALTEQGLRESVLRDLEWLLNTEHLEATEDLAAHPHVQSSVLNYGRPALSGRVASAMNITGLQQRIHQTIIDFEPRILADSLSVRVVYDDDNEGFNSLRFDIAGQLFAQPVPIKLLLQTEVDLESGMITVSDRDG